MSLDKAWGRLPNPRDRYGSRARCILLTQGSNIDVAGRLSKLAAPMAVVDAARHAWMPRGFKSPKEAKLGEVLAFLSEEDRDTVTGWWLAFRRGANTPNWDIASQATIDGAEGLLLIEAKAHTAELKIDGKALKFDGAKARDKKDNETRSEKNHSRIASACIEASEALNRIVPGWNLSIEHHYQLSNRFAWGWKLASLGIPVVLVYLGFLNADEMRHRGVPFRSDEEWRHFLIVHASGTVPSAIWEHRILVEKTPLCAIVRSRQISIHASA